MEEIFKLLHMYGITPNQYQLLWSIREGVGTPHINVSLELRNLKNKGGWILEDGSLSAKAIKLVKEVEGHAKRKARKASKVIMGDNFEEWIKKYNDLWPKKRLPSGRPARSNIKNLEPAFRWFFDTYEYSWEQVIEATKYYLDDREKDDWYYCKTSQYFIRKQNTDKTWHSELADVCQLIEDGGDIPEGGHFSENVF